VLAALLALLTRHPGWGFWKYYYRLRKDGVLVNHKRLWRLYQTQGLQVGRRRPKRRLPQRVRQPLAVPAGPNQCSAGRWTS
jgi:putative transposase